MTTSARPNTGPGPPSASDAGTLLTRDFIAAVVIFHELVGRRLGVSPTDRKCLDLLSRGPVTAGELGRFTGLTSGAVTGIIDRLVAAGYAERVTDPDDRRRVLVSRKPGSKLDQVLPAIFGPLGDDMTKVAALYSSEQLAVIADFLARTRDVLVENTKRLETTARRMNPHASGSDAMSPGDDPLGPGVP